MNPDFQLRIQRYGWDKAAQYYENSWQDQLWPAQESLLAEADPQVGENILDVSCGTGLITMPLAKLVGTTGMIAAIDISDGMIEKAWAEKKRIGLNNINFRQMNAEVLEFEDNLFDVVICSLGLMYFPNPEKALREMVRVLKPGGRALALVWGERKKCGWAGIFPIVDRRVKSDVCPLFFQLGTGNALRTVFEKVGFVKTKTMRFISKLHFRNYKQACEAAFLGGAVALAYQKFDEETRREADREYLDSIQRYHNGMGYDIPGEFVIAEGFKKL